MTPLEWTTYVVAHFERQKQEQRDLLALAWHTAHLTRTREFPSLAKLLEPPVVAEELSTEEAQRQSTFMDVIAEKLRLRNEQRERERAAKGIILTDAPEVPGG